MVVNLDTDRLRSELMSEAQAGNSESYQTLLSEVCMFLQIYLKKKIFNSSHIDDIIQEILLAIHKSRHTYDPQKSFNSWLLAIAHYKMTDYFRSHLKIKNNEIDETIADTSKNSLEILIDQEYYKQLETELNQLDPRSREVITLLKIKGLKISEVASRLKLSESNVKVIAHRAYEKLANQLDPHMNKQ